MWDDRCTSSRLHVSWIVFWLGLMRDCRFFFLLFDFVWEIFLSIPMVSTFRWYYMLCYTDYSGMLLFCMDIVDLFILWFILFYWLSISYARRDVYTWRDSHPHHVYFGAWKPPWPSKMISAEPNVKKQTQRLSNAENELWNVKHKI
jgi:hypothetical protein